MFNRIHSAPVSCVAVKGDYYFTGDKAGSLNQYSVSKMELVKNYRQTHSCPVEALAFSKDGKWLYSGDAYGYLKRFDVEKMEVNKDYGN